ncbi:hypothetical protein ACFY9F_34475 [Streptomyces sp. NPDC012421]|uniref:hypothetical protein n=1 Tax=Streptomyces sp. NPDC012421 TaxID=3364832 RepID=UPI0036E711F3
MPHSVLALLFGVDRSTVTRAVGEIRALLSRTSSLRRPEITAPTVRHRGPGRGRANLPRQRHRPPRREEPARIRPWPRSATPTPLLGCTVGFDLGRGTHDVRRRVGGTEVRRARQAVGEDEPQHGWGPARCSGIRCRFRPRGAPRRAGRGR